MQLRLLSQTSSTNFNIDGEELKKYLKWSTQQDSLDKNKEKDFFESFETVIDKLQKCYNIYYCPQEFNKHGKIHACELQAKRVSSKINDMVPITKEDINQYSIPPSNYADSQPTGNPKYNDFKMLKYWEKHIIPKIPDCLRAELSRFEFEEFFEQLRMPLRVSDHFRAASVAYFLCKNNLPNGCQLPDSNHDWSTLGIDELTVGDWVSMNYYC